MDRENNKGFVENDTDTNSALAPPPFARWVSPEARDMFDALKENAAPAAADVEALRAHFDRMNSARLAVASDRYGVDMEALSIDGVSAYLVNPRSAPRADAILICLHGGAFMWGSGAGTLLEAVPVAAVTGMTVLAVEYRLAPEHEHPSAVEDVLAVMDYLRSENPDVKIGIFGCSAGALLTAQVVSHIIARGDRCPQAIAMLHAAGLDLGGDSLEMAGVVNGTADATTVQRLHDLAYFAGSDPASALVFPGEHPDVLGHFPPALLISGTRDFAASSVTVMHRRLKAAGREAELVIFDGMWHAHHVDVDLPESREVFAIMADFFRRRLG